MESISVKQLRADLPKLLHALQKGNEFLIIYRSKPVGELIPLQKNRRQNKKSPKSLYDFLETPFGEIKLKRGKNSVDLIREDRD